MERASDDSSSVGGEAVDMLALYAIVMFRVLVSRGLWEGTEHTGSRCV